MSGPYCETCKHYWPQPFGGGECDDPSKIIYASGSRINERPEVMPRYECSQHEPKPAPPVTP